MHCRKALNMLCPISGGNWNNGSNAGVWALNLNNVRGNSNSNVGCRLDLVHHCSSSELLKVHKGRCLSGAYARNSNAVGFPVGNFRGSTK